MAWIDEQLSAQFLSWEKRGRGWDIFSAPVTPEPPFRPFLGHGLPRTASIDDGRKPTRLSSWTQSLARRIGGMPPPIEPPEPELDEPGPEVLERGSLVELPMFLPADFDARREEFEQWLASLSYCQKPFAFEIQAGSAAIVVRLVVHPNDVSAVQQQLQNFFPEVICVPRENELVAAWDAASDIATAAVEFGLAELFMRPLAVGKFEPFVALVGAMSEMRAGEMALYQVIFQPVRHDWSESMVRAVTDPGGGAYFVNAPELVGEVKTKVARPLFAAVLRIVARSAEFDRSWEIARGMASALRVFSRPGSNELIPLHNDGYPYEAHVEDVLRRQTRRSGMILNLDELLGFVHFPASEVRSPKLTRHTAKTKAAPALVNNDSGRFFGWNVHLGQQKGVWLTPEQRVRHVHIIGSSGTGKSTLLFNLIRADIEAGEGVGLLDPHGDLVDQILAIIPPERIDDVILFDPADEEFSVGFNILSAHSDLEKTLLASDLVSVFRRLSTSWGDQMGSVLNNAILAFLESPQGGTLADLRRFLLDPAFRERVLQTVGDPDIVYYWRKGFAQLSGNKSIGPVLTRLETFLSPKPIRYMVSQAENRLDFANMFDSGKIFLAKISQGAIGSENSYLFGSLLMAKFQQTAMSRQRQQESARRPFWLYLDEFHHFITPSMAEILSGARKYGLGLTLAHQELRQLQRDPDVASAVSAIHTSVCFRVGVQDAKAMESRFSFFESRDLQNLSTGEAIGRVERNDFDFNLAVPFPERPCDEEARERRRQVVATSREKYATPRAVVEARLRQRNEQESAPRAASEKRPKSPAPAAAPTEEPLPTTPVAPSTEMAPPAQMPQAVEAVSKVGKSVNQPVTEERPVQERPAAVPADLGKGGAQHKAVQSRLKEGANSLGFRVTVEKSILDGAGTVDLVLEREGQTIACEVTVTTTIDHEVGNVAKCLKAGFGEIVAVAINEEKLAKLELAVRNSLGAEAVAKVMFFLPDAFLDYLRALPPPPKPGPKTKRVRGYKVKTTYDQISPEDALAKENEMIRLMGEMMRKKEK